MAGAGAGAAWAVLSAWRTVVAAGTAVADTLWLLPPLIALHLVQLLISALAWRLLLPSPAANRLALYRLRLVREGIDSLLPVAQMGGEVVGAQLLARYGAPLPLSAASVVVDLTLEFLSHLAFLAIGLATWAVLGRAAEPGLVGLGPWLGVTAAVAAMAAGLLGAQRFGVLRLIEALASRIAEHFPALGAVTLDGMQAAASGLYARRGALAAAGGLHLLAWTLGTVESWAVLRALGLDVTWATSLVVESLGMAARSAGFAIPGALAVQEAGFVLAAAAMGLPDSAGLALSLIKRVREVSTGLIGLALWRYSRQAQA